MGLFGSFVAFSLMAACACRRWRMRDGESHGAMWAIYARDICYMLELYAMSLAPRLSSRVQPHTALFCLGNLYKISISCCCVLCVVCVVFFIFIELNAVTFDPQF